MSQPSSGNALKHSPTRELWPEIDRLTPDAVIDLQLAPSWYAGFKVLFDYGTALAMLPLALVFISLAALVIKLTSQGPVFYHQTRVGRGGRLYRIIKLRTMQHNCEAQSGAKWSPANDDRVTRVGRFLRVTHLDELPQLFNVLRGEMSLVGPRPERPEVIRSKGLENVVPGYRHRLLVKPGVTGLAQVQLPADTDITSVRYKVVYDIYYISNQCFFLDLRLIIATLFKAAGVKPRLLRWMFLLPGRDTVAAEFRGNLADGSATFIPHLQPA